jgi:hypothetical protein
MSTGTAKAEVYAIVAREFHLPSALAPDLAAD